MTHAVTSPVSKAPLDTSESNTNVQKNIVYTNYNSASTMNIVYMTVQQVCNNNMSIAYIIHALISGVQQSRLVEASYVLTTEARSRYIL